MFSKEQCEAREIVVCDTKRRAAPHRGGLARDFAFSALLTCAARQENAPPAARMRSGKQTGGARHLRGMVALFHVEHSVAV